MSPLSCRIGAATIPVGIPAGVLSSEVLEQKRCIGVNDMYSEVVALSLVFSLILYVLVWLSC